MKIPNCFNYKEEEPNYSLYKQAIFIFSNGLIFKGTWLSLSNDQ